MTDMTASNPTTTVPVKLGDRSYDILIGAGLIGQAGREIASRAKSVRVAVVTDETVARLHLDRLSQSLSDAGIDSTPIIVHARRKSPRDSRRWKR